MTAVTSVAMPIHNQDDESLPGAPKLGIKKKSKKEKVKANMLKRLTPK